MRVANAQASNYSSSNLTNSYQFLQAHHNMQIGFPLGKNVNQGKISTVIAANCLSVFVVHWMPTFFTVF